MRALADKMLLIALGLTLALLVGAGMPTDADALAHLLAALLVAVAAAGLGEWLFGAARRMPLAVMLILYALGAALWPPLASFLPSLAYDASRLTALTWRRARRPDAMASPSITGERCHGRGSGCVVHARPGALIPAVAGFAWLAPIIVALAGVRTMPAAALAALAATVCATLAGAMMGRRLTQDEATRLTLAATQDRARQESRLARSRIADIDEARAQSVRMATLGERTRIARQIHDDVGHMLTRAIMQAQAGKAVADALGEAQSADGFAALGGTLDDAMTTVRRAVHDLEDDGTDFAAQIEDAAHSFDGVSAGFAVTLANDVADAPAPVARCLSTVIRESLSNVVRHSAAPGASVVIRDFPAIWQLVVADAGPALPDGRDGPDAPVAPGRAAVMAPRAGEDRRGMGLADIEARVRALGGTSQAGPHGTGWRVFVSIPKRGWAVRRADRADRPAAPKEAPC